MHHYKEILSTIDLLLATPGNLQVNFFLNAKEEFLKTIHNEICKNIKPENIISKTLEPLEFIKAYLDLQENNIKKEELRKEHALNIINAIINALSELIKNNDKGSPAGAASEEIQRELSNDPGLGTSLNDTKITTITSGNRSPSPTESLKSNSSSDTSAYGSNHSLSQSSTSSDVTTKTSLSPPLSRAANDTTPINDPLNKESRGKKTPPPTQPRTFFDTNSTATRQPPKVCFVSDV